MATYTITIPNWNPPSLNTWDGRHWAVRARAKSATAELIKTYCLVAGVRPATGKRRVTLMIVLGKGQRANDPDNYWKATLDALKRCGAILDDRRQCVETPPVRFRRATQRATILQLEDLEDGDDTCGRLLRAA